ncbi:MAG: ABC transporter ATP-binding protein, partial [Clostridiales bacterium]|nr:ABC transporter ATP-binding protein [Clostridiales bacterium]
MSGMKRRPQIKSGKSPLSIAKRLMGEILKEYKLHCIIVLICIFGSAFANVKGTLFMQKLIDNYIVPMLNNSSKDFGPLAAAIGKIAIIYGIGVVMMYAYNRIMVNVTQGTMKRIRQEMFEHMESLPIKYFDTHAHGDIMSIYTNDTDTLRQMIGQSL